MGNVIKMLRSRLAWYLWGIIICSILQGLCIASLFGSELPYVVKLQNEQGLCSGVCVDAQGLILTAKHCKHGESVLVTWPDGRTETAKRVYKGPGIFDGVTAYDLPGDDWPSVPISDKPPQAGQTVWLCGYPLGKWQSWKASVIGQSRHISLERFTVVNKATQPGWSGGPLIDASGKVVGLLSHTDAGGQGNSYFVDLGRVQKAYTQACRDGYCRPPSLAGPQPGTSPELPPSRTEPQPEAQPEPESLSDFEGVVIALVTPELLEGRAGVAADILGPAAFGVPRRLVKQVSEGKARFEGISERLEPEKFAAITNSLELPTAQPSLVAFIPKTSQGLLKGLVVKKVEAEIVARLEGVLFSPIFERVSSADYLAGLEALSKTYEPDEQEYEREDQSIVERARQAALDEIGDKLPNKEQLAASVVDKIRPHLPAEVKEKAEQAATWWEIYQRGGLALLLISLIGGRVHAHLEGKKTRGLLSVITQAASMRSATIKNEGRPSQPSSPQ